MVSGLKRSPLPPARTMAMVLPPILLELLYTAVSLHFYGISLSVE
jgi:hypothetical protein